MNNELLIAIISSLGLGGFLSTLFTSWVNKNKSVLEAKKEQMRKRYLAIMILMFTRLDLKKQLTKLGNHRPDINTLDDLENELDLEILNSLIFASDKVVRTLKNFNNNPTKENYLKTALAMRDDLWGGKTSITEKDIN